MSRFSQLVLSRRNPVVSAVTYCNNVMAAYPFATGVGITMAKTTAADLLVQFVIEQQRWDLHRTALFASFGCLYQGAVQYAIVNLVLEPAFPGNMRRAVLSKIFCMNFISDPLLFLPTFYVFKEVASEQEKQKRLVPTLSLPVVAKGALEKYKQNCYEDWRNTWSVWIPGHFVTYAICPLHLRLPWMSVLSFGYVLILSLTRGSLQNTENTKNTAR